MLENTSKTKGVLRSPFFVLTACAVLLSLAVFLGFIWGKRQALKNATQLISTIKPIRENNFNYKYINPLLAYDFSGVNSFFVNQTLDDKLHDFAAEQVQQGNATNIAVYVRNFTNNSWAGVSEDEQYHPGSILKVLIMMAYFREAQLDPTVLQKNLVYSNEVSQYNNSIEFSQSSSLKIGQPYSVVQLINSMIAESDNGAETLLIENVDRNILNSAYEDLSIPNPDNTTGDYTISARQYSAFLRILYNSTYLSENYSEQSLGIMAKSTFKDGLVAGLPTSVEVAHKYGERVSGANGNIIELHDCGIVYAPTHPYSICVMTKGGDISKLSNVIKNASDLVYSTLLNK